MRKALVGIGLVAVVAGCHAPTIQALAPVQAPGSPAIATEHGRVAVTIQWPYRAQVIPTSTERLRFTLSGSSTAPFDLVRPVGTAPLSTASFALDVGSGYTLTVEAFAKEFTSDLSPALLVASGQSAPFDVAANKVASVRVVLDSVFVPTITGFSPTNGGPGTYVTVTGTNFGASRGLSLGFRFGGTSATMIYPADDGTASVLVPDTATTSPLVPVADGVSGVASGSFTVLSALSVLPGSQAVASGSTHRFTATATTTEGEAYPSPTVQWALSTDSVGVVDQTGLFTAKGTGTAEIQVYSGRLLGTASITVP